MIISCRKCIASLLIVPNGVQCCTRIIDARNRVRRMEKK
uniref:Uncharacterized protein n=1 Tax=Setaria italica TaxID=4555 RepID=K3XUN2_SETIT